MVLRTLNIPRTAIPNIHTPTCTHPYGYILRGRQAHQSVMRHPRTWSEQNMGDNIDVSSRSSHMTLDENRHLGRIYDLSYNGVRSIQFFSLIVVRNSIFVWAIWPLIRFVATCRVLSSRQRRQPKRKLDAAASRNARVDPFENGFATWTMIQTHEHMDTTWSSSMEWWWWWWWKGGYLRVKTVFMRDRCISLSYRV
jgi:hypothetical protein